METCLVKLPPLPQLRVPVNVLMQLDIGIGSYHRKAIYNHPFTIHDHHRNLNCTQQSPECCWRLVPFPARSESQPPPRKRALIAKAVSTF
ncbi:hypothetical protein llap_10889 [Limosa lapponica baueri]|uniref:Uncharacterized protein n=1 Tax=Limosa lapponica baueri TaxID=1758121 RepID=A0A2I0TY97_LIMLA|nr:hypothetical protein llap_10889 [Limosa lapponica baueri]